MTAMNDAAQDLVAITNEVHERYGKDTMVGVFEHTGGSYQWEVTSKDGHIVAIVDANTMEEARARAESYYDVLSVKRYFPLTTAGGAATGSAVPVTQIATGTPATTTPAAGVTPAATTTPATTTTVVKTYPPAWAKRVTDAVAKFQTARKDRDAVKKQARGKEPLPDTSTAAASTPTTDDTSPLLAIPAATV